jgi:hypothetical protein
MLPALFLALMQCDAATARDDPAQADYYVSPKGNDDWSGKTADPRPGDGPFATLARARDAVRELQKTLPNPRIVRVVVRGGSYELESPLVFGPED